MDYRIEVIVIGVTDVDRSKAFYVDGCGFPLDIDTGPSETFRFVQVTPPGSGCSIAFGTNVAGMPPGSLRGVQLCVADADAAQADLASRGVPVTAVQHFVDGAFVDGRGGDWNSWCFFSDPDGNAWSVQESPVLRAAGTG